MADTPNYKETEVAGQAWQRAVRVVIENPYQGLPFITYVEEKVYNIGEKSITEPVANLGVGFNLEDQLHVDIYTKLNELYTVLRDQRDNPVVIPPMVPEAPPVEPPATPEPPPAEEPPPVEEPAP